MPAKKKPVPYSRPRLSRSEGELALMKAAYDLMCEKDVADVTTTDIAERAGLNRAHISRYFGTRSELLAASVEHDFFEGINRFVEARKSNPDLVYDLFGSESERLRQRHKIVTYLISIGVPQSRFHESQKLLTERIAFFFSDNNLSPAMNRVLVQLSTFLMLSFQTYAELQQATEEDRRNLYLIVALLAKYVEPLEKDLGWK